MSGTSWRRISQRLLQMDRAEITDRLRQQAMSRWDVLRFKCKLNFAPRLIEGASGAPRRFFFSPETVPGLCNKLSQIFPETSQQIIERAERICRHRFDLLGYTGLDYEAEIDWHCDRVHGTRAARKPWFQIRYLNFSEVGDSKVTWELNRHQHLVILAKAYRLSGGPKYADELFRQWNHWHTENPYPIGINWASSLEVAFRSLSWIWMYYLLAGSAVMPAGFRAEWLRSLAISGRHIDTYLSTYFSPNTHLLGEAVALFFIGTLCPEIPAAHRWQKRGWEIVQKEADRQVRPDGFHFEQSTYYHVYALDFFLHSAVLASLNQIPASTEFDQTIEGMLNVLAVLARGGAVPQFGDDDGGRLFDPARNLPEHLLDPLATGAVLFGRGDFKALAGEPREETLWLLGEEGLREFDRIPPVQPARSSTSFQSTGLYVMAGDDPESQLVVDAGPQGAHTAGHGHADALSLTLCVDGRELLTDSGTLEYVGADGERDRFRGTRAHNTLQVAGCDQAEPIAPFNWGKLPNVHSEAWIAGKTFDLFAGSHDGYSRLSNPVIHRRTVFALKNGLWIVRDQALGTGEHELDLHWHLSPSLRLGNKQENLFLDENRLLRFVTVEGEGWTRRVEEHPHSLVYGQQQTHNVLRFSTRMRLPAEFLTVLSAEHGVVRSQDKLTRISALPSSRPAVAGYRYITDREEHCVFFGSGDSWELDQWSSDARFLYWRHSPDGQSTLIGCQATYVKRNQQAVMTAKQPFLRCEIMDRGDQFDVVSSDPDLIVDRNAWASVKVSTESVEQHKG